MKKILIANRGEIACRIIESCKKLNIHSVAVFSDADKKSKHVRLADESFHIGSSKAQESYLSVEKIYKYERGLDFITEFYADLNYDKDGTLIISKGKNKDYDSELSVERCLRAIAEKKVRNTGGTDTVVGADTICVHSDTPNAIEIITKINNAIKK